MFLNNVTEDETANWLLRWLTRLRDDSNLFGQIFWTCVGMLFCIMGTVFFINQGSSHSHAVNISNAITFGSAAIYAYTLGIVCGLESSSQVRKVFEKYGPL